MPISTRLLAALLACALVVGCTNMQRYEGPPRSRSEIVILEKNTEPGLLIKKINGQGLGWTGHDRYELLPGEVVLDVGYDSWGTRSVHPLRVTFQAEAGRTYRLDFTRKDLRWTIYVLDKATGVRVATGVASPD